jgi:hypothetical protein
MASVAAKTLLPLFLDLRFMKTPLLPLATRTRVRW